jgi:outer membrane protein
MNTIMKSKKKLVQMLILSFLLANVSSFAQKSFTLEECINYSATNNSNIKIANYEVEISKKKINEQKGFFLPQLNASGTLDNNLQLQTQLMPAEMSGGTPGTYIPVAFGNKYSLSAGVQFTQKLYDPTYWLGIKSAKVNKEMSVQNLEKTNEQTVFNISTIYYQTLVKQMQINVLESTLIASEQSLKSIELKFSNGMAKKIDVDKIKVSYNNTKYLLQRAELIYSQSLNTLKYQMGMPIDSLLTLADTSLDTISDYYKNVIDSTYQNGNIIDYKLNQTNLTSMQIDKKKNIAAFSPSLSFYGNYNYSAMRQEFNFFNANKDWYPSSGIGIKLTIPIFDGLQRNSRLAQSELNIKKAKENLLLTEQSIKVDISNFEIQFKNAIDNITSEKENLDLAESVYKNTQLDYQQGTGSTLDLIQAESSYMVAQSTYFNKLLDLYIARIELEKAKGTLMNFVNNQK